MKLRPKILLLVISVLATSFIALSVPLYWYTRSALEDELDRHLLSIVQLANQNLNPDIMTILLEEPSLPSIRKNLINQMEFYLTDQIESVGIYTIQRKPLLLVGNKSTMNPQLTGLIDRVSKLDAPNPAAVSELYQLSDGQYFKTAASTIPICQKPIAVFVVTGGAQFMASIDQLFGAMFWITIVSIIVAVSLSIIFSRALIHPVSQLSEYTKAIKNNINTAPINLGRKDELGDLNQSLVEMHNEIKLNEQKNKQFLSGIAHDIKNPLGGIEIYTGLLKEELNVSGEHQNYLDKIITELHNLKQIVLSYLDYARPPRSDVKPIAIETIVTDVHRLLIPEINQKKIKFQCSGTGIIQGDESKLRRIFLNLFKNGIEAVDVGGMLEVKIANNLSSLAIEIIDDGSGILKHDLNYIFEPYYSTSESGYGLGLAIVKTIIEEMNGTIFVESEEGIGTKFMITFPKEHEDKK